MATDAVVDSSVIVALVTLEEQSDWAEKAVQNYEYFHILDLSFYEVANALEHKRSSCFDAEDARTAFKQAQNMMNLYAVHSFSEVITESLNKALEFKIAVYDSAFLSLADKLQMPFLTLDTKLTKKLAHTRYAEVIRCPNKAP
jgi:predicted nucleic acid-binding protein